VADLHTAGPHLLGVSAPVLALVALAGYLWLVASGSRPWPRRRTVSWLLGCAAVGVALSGPLVEAAAADDTGYVAHMVTHLLLGMVAPLLLVLGAPITLLLRSLRVPAGRRVSRMLTSLPVRILTEPLVAATLSIGGLWLLYTTELYAMLHHEPVVHVVVHAHLFFAGYLFTVSMISVDPLPHRRSVRHRSIVLILALAGHGILAKHLYAYPPAGVAGPPAETGAMIMYYGGDLVDLVIMIVLGRLWYRAAGRGRDRPPRRVGNLRPIGGDSSCSASST
jgi:putative membrane protein